MGKTIKKLLVEAMCPVTTGQKSRMPEATFARLCEAKRAMGSAAPGGFHFMNQRCLQCKGERGNWPDELEILTADDLEAANMEERTMATKGCEVCGRNNTSVKNCRGKLACSSCQVMMAAIANRPDAVVAAAEITGMKDALAEKLEMPMHYEECEREHLDPEQAAAWQMVAEAVGGEAGQGTAMEVASEAARIIALAKESGGTIAELESGIWSLENDLASIAKAVGLPADTKSADIAMRVQEWFPAKDNQGELEKQLHEAQELVSELAEREEMLAVEYRRLQEELASAKRLLQERQETKVNGNADSAGLINAARRA